MKDNLQRINHLQSLKESELRAEILVPLFEAMGFHDVIEFHGALEFGKDIVFYEEDKFGERIYYSVVVKAQDIHGSVGKSGSASEVLFQAQQALAELWIDPFNGQQHMVDRIIIATSGKITQAAAMGVKEHLRRSHVRFLHGTRILSLVDKYAPGLLGAAVAEEHMGNADRERLISEEWHQVVSDGSPVEKGRHLEQLTRHLFESIPGFVDAVTNVRSPTEELDIILRNESTDPFWSRLGAFIVIEVKHWARRKVGREQFAIFAGKVARKAGWCRVGFFVSITGFTRAFLATAAQYVENNPLIVPIDREGLEQLVRSRDREKMLRSLVIAAVRL